jgi:type VI secretion system protein ImpH
MAEAQPITPDKLRQLHEAWLVEVTQSPHRFDFYQVMRRFASAHPHLPLLGEALRPVDEPLRVAQPAELDFAPAEIHGLERRAGSPPRLMQRAFGLLGPNGVLPLHLTEYARERALHHGDATFQRFLDMLTHRYALLFYRAWAEAQPAVSLDRPGNKSYFNRLGALVGVGLASLQDRDALPDVSKLYFAGRLSRQTRDAEGLLAWCRIEFDVPVAIEQWCGHWMPLARAERSRLGRRDGALLGRSTVLGSSVWDVQHKFRITMGPLRLDRYRRLLPGGADLARLQALVRHWVGLEFEWDLRLVLARDDVPRCQLGAGGSALGHTAWLGHYRRPRDADDLCIDVERSLARRARRKASAARAADPLVPRPRGSGTAARRGEPA